MALDQSECTTPIFGMQISRMQGRQIDGTHIYVYIVGRKEELKVFPQGRMTTNEKKMQIADLDRDKQRRMRVQIDE